MFPSVEASSFSSRLVILCALETPTRANELAQNLGLVGAHEPILTMIGSQRVIALRARR
jgi:hypothetical protein